MVFAIRQDRLGFLLIDQIKSKVGGNRSQMKEIGVRDEFADGTAKRFGVSGVSNRQLDLFQPLCGRAWQRSLHRRLRLRLPPFVLIPIEYSVLDRQAARQK